MRTTWGNMENKKNDKARIIVILGLMAIVAIAGCIDRGKSINSTNEKNDIVATQIPGKTSEVGISSSTSGVMERYSLERLVSLSDIVAIAEVVDILPSRWNTQNGEKPTINNGTHSIIYTDVNIKIVEYLKGSLNNTTITVRTIGGIVGQDKQYVEDQPLYNINEKVLVFLKNDSDPRTVGIGNKHFVTTGSMQGKIIIPTSNELIIGDIKMSLEDAKAIIGEKGEKSYGNI
jgi:hypothetical protein